VEHSASIEVGIIYGLRGAPIQAPAKQRAMDRDEDE
jgi:hypothetical protein